MYLELKKKGEKYDKRERKIPYRYKRARIL